MRSKWGAAYLADRNPLLAALICGCMGGLGFVMVYGAFEFIADEGFDLNLGAVGRVLLESRRFWTEMRWPLFVALFAIVAGLLIYFRGHPSKSTDNSVSLDILRD
jgi:hypothetical protein